MELGIEGIKCDADGCDYEDMSIEWGSTPEDMLRVNDEFLTKLCPKCGARLLTDEDHASVKMMVALLPELNALEKDLADLFPEDSPANEQLNVRMSMDGSGQVGIDKIEKA